MIITIDPGISGSGIALWKTSAWNAITPVLLSAYNKYFAGDTYDEKLRSAVLYFSELFDCSNISEVIIEKPDYQDSAKGQVSARSSSLSKLCIFYGGIVGVGINKKIKIIEYPVVTWKGQLKKDMVNTRIQRAYRQKKFSYKGDIPFEKLKSHCLDAIGIGLYDRGIINR